MPTACRILGDPVAWLQPSQTSEGSQGTEGGVDDLEHDVNSGHIPHDNSRSLASEGRRAARRVNMKARQAEQFRLSTTCVWNEAL